tara:strand:- start:81 stop:611 length:531 start_codon:yes stop_codon:yes gene_type:complete
MGESWEYKEDTWEFSSHNAFSLVNGTAFSDEKEPKILEKHRKSLTKNQFIMLTGQTKKTDPDDKRRRLIVSHYRIIELHSNRLVAGEHRGYILDENGYPKSAPISYHKEIEFSTPPVDLDDAKKQLTKLYRDTYWDFPTWLGHHSKDGWEIFKISRDFKSDREHQKTTWCVFRRRI